MEKDLQFLFMEVELRNVDYWERRPTRWLDWDGERMDYGYEDHNYFCIDLGVNEFM